LISACKSTTFSETPPQNPEKSFFFPAVPVIRITLEEIVVQQVSHLEQQVGITSLSKVYNGEFSRRIRRTLGTFAALRRHALRHCERSEAIQAIDCFLFWIASFLAMTRSEEKPASSRLPMIPIVLRETYTPLRSSTIPDSKRQQTTTVDNKCLINGLFLTRFVILQQKNIDRNETI